MNKMELSSSINDGIYNAMQFYSRHPEFSEELKHFKRIEDKKFGELPVDKIKSSGYVVDTLEAAIWCLLNTKGYKECVLKAVNLGEDTDTVAAVTGGLAGLRYGYDSIPKDWINKIARKEYIENLCNELGYSLMQSNIKKLISYIPYFEKATKESSCKWKGGGKNEENVYSMAYPVYDETMMEFVNDFYRTNFACYEYMKTFEKIDYRGTNEFLKLIDDADFYTVKAILTGYIRQERFGDGLWESAIEDKIFLHLLKRLQKLS